MIYGFGSRNEKKVSMKNYDKLPKAGDIVVLDRRRLDSTRGTLIP